MLWFEVLFGVNIFFASSVIFCSNPIYSIISFVFVILGSSLILFMLQVEFLAYIILLVYLGAIVVLFLFIILVLQLKETKPAKSDARLVSIDKVFFFFLTGKICNFLYFYNLGLDRVLSIFSYEYFCTNCLYGSISKVMLVIGGDAAIFLNLFTVRWVYFVMVGFILLYAMVGAIALCVRQPAQA